MSENEQISKIIRIIETAEASLKSANELLRVLAPGAIATSQAKPITGENASTYENGTIQIVEGTFDGQNMIGPNDKIYPVPANYASKSKLIEGDRLKLSIQENGSFLYKQIAPIKRKFIKGTLINEDGQYKVIIENSSYRVLLASVTYYKGTVGDEVTLILPEEKESIWGAIEAIIPQVAVGNYKSEDSM